ncbi:hypothetical protein ASG54_19680 [Aureimonas sp. Leaf460]|nr:hypothetical protein ASG62_11480 [Aureimonas sp. Leaf427]KQT71701.1 hypothetical protein ASG54_19680 [Aureimonas sp. Leaf460]
MSSNAFAATGRPCGPAFAARPDHRFTPFDIGSAAVSDGFACHRKTEEPVMTKLIARFAKNESGATAIEYGLIAALMSVAVIAAFPTLKTALSTTFSSISSNMAAVK